MNHPTIPQWLTDRLNVERFAINSRMDTRVTSHAITISTSERQALERILESWGAAFAPTRPNLMHNIYGVSSPLVRIDYVLEAGRPFIFEVDDRPFGWAISGKLNPRSADGIAERFQKLEEGVGKPIAFCISDNRRDASDDALFAEGYLIPRMGIRRIKIGMPDRADWGAHMWWIRSDDTEPRYADMSEHSISTLCPDEGDKGYGLRMGLWQEIPKDLGELAPVIKKGCVFKPTRGSRFCVQIVHGGMSTRESKASGCITASQAEQMIERGSLTYWQRYVPHERHDFLNPPEEDPRGKPYGLVRRVMFAFNPMAGRFECVGGIWCAVPDFRGHGTSSSIFGPAICE